MHYFLPANILLPKDVSYEKWAVIACDQFTADPDYWTRVRQTAADSPSTVHMILPEAELDREHTDTVKQINRTMQTYLADGVLQEYKDAYVYVERTLENGMIRKGIIGMVDLECYDYHPGSESLIRATEMTVLERIPPRKEVRKDAPIELPHILMLCDDASCKVIEGVAAKKQELPVLYDFDLMEEGGHITGWLLQGQAVADFCAAFAVYSDNTLHSYTDLTGAKVLLAVGDGNHSLATAKSCYEERKAAHPDEDLTDHPSRYALVELENIHDPALTFEPIHRVLFDVDCKKLLEDIQSICSPEGYEVRYVAGTKEGILSLNKDYGELAVAVLQNFLDDWLQNNAGRIDYIHGDEEVRALARKNDSIGFLLPTMEKDQLFRGVIDNGVLPRKTFSMGHAREKRYYLEGRKIQ